MKGVHVVHVNRDMEDYSIPITSGDSSEVQSSNRTGKVNFKAAF